MTDAFIWVESCPGAKKSFEAPSATIRLLRRGHVAAIAYNAYFAYVAYDKFTVDTSRSWSIWLGRWRVVSAAASCERGPPPEEAAAGEREGSLPIRAVLQGVTPQEHRDA